VMGDAIAQAVRPIVAAIKARTPVDSGALRRSITATVKRYPNGGKIIGFVGPDRDYYAAGKRLKKGASKKGSDRPAMYAHLPEFGHRKAGGEGTVAAKPFMRPGVAAGTPLASANLVGAVEKGMEREINRLSRKRARLARTGR
jgi:NaMN:DMB phosphoribosyltransferase